MNFLGPVIEDIEEERICLVSDELKCQVEPIVSGACRWESHKANSGGRSAAARTDLLMIMLLLDPCCHATENC